MFIKALTVSLRLVNDLLSAPMSATHCRIATYDDAVYVDLILRLTLLMLVWPYEILCTATLFYKNQLTVFVLVFENTA